MANTAQIVRYTTPVHKVILRGADLTGYEVHVTYRQEPGHNQSPIVIDKTGLDVALVDEDTVITCPLTQEETGSLMRGRVAVQVNWIDGTGFRDAVRRPKILQVIDNELEGVIEYGEQ